MLLLLKKLLKFVIIFLVVVYGIVFFLGAEITYSDKQVLSNISEQASNNKPKINNDCQSGYYKNASKTSCLKVPENATKYSGAEAWYCNSGYKKSGEGCVKKVATKTTESLKVESTKSLKVESSSTKWWERTDKYAICYGNVTRAHKANGLHDRNRALSVKMKEEICKIAATSTTGEGCYWIGDCP